MRTNAFTRACTRCNRVYNAGMVLQCPHPRVQEIYGTHICLYCCKRCMHHENVPYIDGIRCGYNKEGEPIV